MLAAADEEPARRRALGAMNEGGSADPSSRIAGANDLLDRAARGLVERFGRAAQLAIVEHGEDRALSALACRFARLQRKIHGVS